MSNEDYLSIIKQLKLNNIDQVKGLIDLFKLKNTLDLNINLVDRSGNTALHLAIIKENKEIAELLLNNNATPDIYNFKGESPLYLAVCVNNRELVSLLLKFGASPTAKSEKSKSPYELALLKSRNEIQSLFLVNSNQCKASIEVTDRVYVKKHIKRNSMFLSNNDTSSGNKPNSSEGILTRTRLIKKPQKDMALSKSMVIQRVNSSDSVNEPSTEHKDTIVTQMNNLEDRIQNLAHKLLLEQFSQSEQSRPRESYHSLQLTNNQKSCMNGRTQIRDSINISPIKKYNEEEAYMPSSICIPTRNSKTLNLFKNSKVSRNINAFDPTYSSSLALAQSQTHKSSNISGDQNQKYILVIPKK